MAQKVLSADLDVIQKSGLEISLLEGDLNIIQKLDDEPNDVGGLSAQDLKAEFDRAGNIIKEYINGTLVPEVLSEGITEQQRRESEAARESAEAGRRTAEQGRAEAESARASAISRFLTGVAARADGLPVGSRPTARAEAENGSFRLVLGIPEGRQGIPGPPGRPGNNGVALAGSGMFAFFISEAGHLIVSCTGDAAPDLSVDGTGHLILKL